MRLIDADLMIANGFKNKTIEVRTEDIIESHEKVVKLLFRDAVDFINKQPTVDAVEVVRCKDCKYWVVDSIFKTGWCNNKRRVMETSNDWYCADGERGSE